MKCYRVLRRMYVHPGEIVTLGTIEPAAIRALIEKRIVELALEEDERDEEEVDDGD